MPSTAADGSRAPSTISVSAREKQALDCPQVERSV